MLFETFFCLSRYDFRFPKYSHTIYLQIWLNLVKIIETLKRYNFEDSHFRSINERSLEARNLPLQNVFLFISIRFPVPELSSCKEKDNFQSLIIFILVRYSDLSLAPRLTDLSQTADKDRRRDSWKKHIVHKKNTLWVLYFRNRLRRMKQKKDFNDI